MVPLSFVSGEKNSKIHFKNWLKKTQALCALDISLNNFQEKNMSSVNIGEDRIYSYEKVKGKAGCSIRHKTPRPDRHPSPPTALLPDAHHPKNPRELSAVL